MKTYMWNLLHIVNLYKTAGSIYITYSSNPQEQVVPTKYNYLLNCYRFTIEINCLNKMLCRHIAAGAIRTIAASGAVAVQINLPLFTSRFSMKLIIAYDIQHGHDDNDIEFPVHSLNLCLFLIIVVILYTRSYIYTYSRVATYLYFYMI